MIRKLQSLVTSNHKAEASTFSENRAELQTAITTSPENEEILALLKPPQQPGEFGRLGSYRIRQTLGRGGMGMVFEAFEERLQRSVALKVMNPDLAKKPDARERFLREARAAASLNHDHVVPIYHVDEQDGIPFISMPMLKGEPLDVRLKRVKPLPIAEAIRIGRETAEGLAAAHAIGLIHRDIKPGNIWLEDGRRVKILDFGLARRAEGTEQLTQTGAILGTPSYMAAGTGSRQECRSSRRSLQLGRDALRNDHRPASVYGQRSDRDSFQSRARYPGPAQ